MTKSSRTFRQERIDSLCTDIQRMTLCHDSLPPGELRDSIAEDIEKVMEQVNQLNRPTMAESPSGQRAAYLISGILLLGGIVLNAYQAVALGALIAFGAVMVAERSSR